MKVRVWGARGSLAVSGPDMMKYGGNTSCVEVRDSDGNLLVLDAGTGMRRLGEHVEEDLERLDILLSHFHVDHLFGFGFFSVLFREDVEVHIWGPASDAMRLRARLNRYLSPPLFPVRLPDLPAKIVLHDVRPGTFDLPGMQVTADFVCHPGKTMGYRVESEGGVVTYLSDHEPMLGIDAWPEDPAWQSGWALSRGADLLIHDAQYTEEEYAQRVGWGHTTVPAAVEFARRSEARHLLAFHHDPDHDDYEIDAMFAEVADRVPDGMQLSIAREAASYDVNGT